MTAKLSSIQPVLMSRDILRSLEFYQKLGFQITFADSKESPCYAGVSRDGLELHLQWHDSTEWEYPNDRPTYRFVVEEVDQLWDEFKASGVTSMTEVWETDWGTREFHIQDPDKNGLQFYRDR